MTVPEYIPLSREVAKAVRNPHKRREARAWGLWAYLQDISEDERIKILEDKRGLAWGVPCPISVACWVCKELGLRIFPDFVRFEDVPIPRVHNFYRRATNIREKSEAGVLRYRDAWTGRHNPAAFGKIESMYRDDLPGGFW